MSCYTCNTVVFRPIYYYFYIFTFVLRFSNPKKHDFYIFAVFLTFSRTTIRGKRSDKKGEKGEGEGQEGSGKGTVEGKGLL